MSLWFFDAEVFLKDWIFVFINPITRTKEVIVNDSEKLKEFYEGHKNDIFVAFNGKNYDVYIFKAILLDYDPKEVSDWIIVKGRKGWEYTSLFNKINLNIYDAMIGVHGLKTLEAFQGNNIKESSVDFNIDRKLNAEELAETIKYCENDVFEMIRVFLKRKGEFDAHVSLIKTFGLNISNISKTQAQLAAMILGAKKQYRNDEWNIRLPHTLQLGKYKHIGDWFLKDENHKYDSRLTTNIADVPHVIALGGLHGAKNNYLYTCKSDEVLIMADVDQLYPTIMVEYNLLSRNIKDPESFKKILAKSLELKALGLKKEREPYKRICNISYGAEGDKHNPMYDPLHRNLVCIFGQVFMIDLIDKIENICELIQSNTDGILIKIKKDNVDRFKQEVNKWQERTKLHMSFDEYVKVVQKDVNNYILIDDKGNYKTKGAYVKKLNDLDYNLAIVNEAVVNYLVYKIPVEETILNCKELKKFQQIVKVSSNYDYAVHGCKKLKEKTLRVFFSNSLLDGGVYKVKKGKQEKFADLSTNCFIINEDINGMKIPMKLDYQYYITISKRRISQFIGKDFL